MATEILIVDDEQPILELLSEMLTEQGFSVTAVTRGEDAVEAFQGKTFQLVIADLIMPGMSGLEVIGKIKTIDPDVEVIVLTGYATIDNAVQALRNYKAFDFLTKPLENLDALYNTIEKALERRKLQIENKSLIEALRQANDELERRVKARTMELAQLNARLRKELVERGETEEKLRKAKNSAEVANRIKSDFLSNMSHELRNPLNSVIGFAQVLLDKYYGELTEKQEEYVRDIHDSGYHLLSLINDILDLTNLENDRKALNPSPVNINELIKNSLNYIRQKSLKHDVELSLTQDQELENLQVMLDGRKIKQVMFYLLSNALKFSHDGGSLEVSARKIPIRQSGLILSDGTPVSDRIGPEDTHAIEIVVADRGAGIAPEDQEKIFEEFYQVKSGTRDKTPGAGIGLSLAKRLVELHGGQISVDSKGEGKGSRFKIVLPFQEPEDEEFVLNPQ